MVVKKIEIKPKGDGTYSDVLYPKTSPDMVIDEATGTTVATHMAENVTQLAAKMDKKIVDDATSTKYELGFKNGLLYFRVVV
jgi:hypothetical protein